MRAGDDARHERGPGETPLKTAMEWWGIYADLIGYGRRPGAKEMIDVSLGGQDKGRLDAIRREIQYAQREPIKKFFSFLFLIFIDKKLSH